MLTKSSADPDAPCACSCVVLLAATVAGSPHGAAIPRQCRSGDRLPEPPGQDPHQPDLGLHPGAVDPRARTSPTSPGTLAPGRSRSSRRTTPTTGTSSAVQNLYTLTGTATWSFVRSVPIVKPMTWHPPTDYAFPFSGFALYTVGSGGGVGAPVATSPKVNFCMTPDTLVGGVPNTTATASPRRQQLLEPERPAGPVGRLGRRVRLHRLRQQHRHLEPGRRDLLAAGPGRSRRLLHRRWHRPERDRHRAADHRHDGEGAAAGDARPSADRWSPSPARSTARPSRDRPPPGLGHRRGDGHQPPVPRRRRRRSGRRSPPVAPPTRCRWPPSRRASTSSAPRPSTRTT